MTQPVLQHYRRNAFGMTLARACLVAILLWAQSATAQHELDHVLHDSTELCQVFSSAEHSKALASAPQTQLDVIASQAVSKTLSIPVLEFSVVVRCARSPPFVI